MQRREGCRTEVVEELGARETHKMVTVEESGAREPGRVVLVVKEVSDLVVSSMVVKGSNSIPLEAASGARAGGTGMKRWMDGMYLALNLSVSPSMNYSKHSVAS